MGKIKNFLKKDIDLGTILSVLIIFPTAIYKLFFQTENRTWSIVTGAIFSILSISLIFILIKNKGKRD